MADKNDLKDVLKAKQKCKSPTKAKQGRKPTNKEIVKKTITLPKDISDAIKPHLDKYDIPFASFIKEATIKLAKERGYID